MRESTKEIIVSRTPLRSLLMFSVLMLFTLGPLLAEPEPYFRGAPSSFWAGQIELGLSNLGLVSGLDTSVFIGGEIAYSDLKYYRRADASPFLPGDADFSEEALSINRFRGSWRTGVRQGLLPPSQASENPLYAQLYYQGTGFTPVSNISGSYIQQAGRIEASGFVSHAIHFGVSFDNSMVDNHFVEQGFNADVRLEWAPAGINPFSEYMHTALELKYFLPIFDLAGEEEPNRLSLFLAHRSRIRYLTGKGIPLEEAQSESISIRGIESERFDTSILANSSIELRLNLPAVFIPQLIPGFLIFTDFGWYSDLSEYEGVLLSHGAGLFLNIFDIVQIGGRLSILSIGQKIDSGIFTPFELMIFYQY